MNSNWFDGNNSLVLLDLRRNQLTSVERSHFQYLNKLIDLDLSDNSIKNIEYFALAEATYLQRVSFRYNRLRNITNIGPLLSLESLDFSSNSISSVSKITNLFYISYSTLLCIEIIALDSRFFIRWHEKFSQSYTLG